MDKTTILTGGTDVVNVSASYSHGRMRNIASVEIERVRRTLVAHEHRYGLAVLFELPDALLPLLAREAGNRDQASLYVIGSDLANHLVADGSVDVAEIVELVLDGFRRDRTVASDLNVTPCKLCQRGGAVTVFANRERQGLPLRRATPTTSCRSFAWRSWRPSSPR